MKNLILTAIVTLTALSAFARNSERVILSDSKTFTTEISTKTVRCSRLGYGMGLLKINLSGLDGWTVFDHSNAQVGEFGEPCMAATACDDLSGGDITDFIQKNNGKPTAVVTVTRQLSELRTETKDQSGQDVCVRSLRETLHTTINGVSFNHVRTGAEQTFGPDFCK